MQTQTIRIFEGNLCHSVSGRRNLANRKAVDTSLKWTSKILFKFYLFRDLLTSCNKMRTERFTGKEEKMLLKMEWVGEKSNTSYCWEYFPYHQKYQYLDASWENSKVCDLTTANLQKHPVDLSQSRRSQQCHPCLEIFFFFKEKN